MADIIDNANAAADVFLDAALRNRQHGARIEVSAVPAEGAGFCLYCGTDVDSHRRWCGADCRDLWQRDQQRKGR